ncbi:hypothetical protein JTE90_022287 [Oedothorax gibbosus]|uniref:Uncharacterized protein n=1 Tax=Oedothorax gibbosus TaxID=931172 RepID=A0AAV6VVA3_9ARAC|nr:hypothetical protein JTE90_022287 [Oedothorax gibbosus]
MTTASIPREPSLLRETQSKKPSPSILKQTHPSSRAFRIPKSACEKLLQLRDVTVESCKNCVLPKAKPILRRHFDHS